MIHFQKLIIKNFQSHVYTEFHFHPGLNVFVGPSDSGKSAILRALQWVLFNAPRGTEYIRVGANLCEVELHLNDGTIIRRIRNHHSINRYQLEKLGEEPQVFEGFGSEVPLEIANAHQFKPLQLEQKDIYLQVGHQLEGPFLLSESSGMKAKTIGLVSGAHLIDRALKKLNSDRLQLASKNKYLQQQLENVEEKLVPFEDLEDLEKELLQAEHRAMEIKEKQSFLIQLKQLEHKYMQNVQEQQTQKSILDRFPNIQEAEHNSIALENKLLYLRQYRQIFVRYQIHKEEKNIQKSIYDKTEMVSKAKQIQRELESKLKQIDLYKKLQVQYQKIQEGQDVLQKILNKTKNVEIGLHKVDHVENQRNQLLSLLKIQKSWFYIEQNKEKIDQFLKENQNFLSHMMQRLPDVESNLLALTNLKTYLIDLTDKQERIAKGYQWLDEIDKNVRELVMQYGDLLTEQGECPICGSEINDQLIQHLLHELEGGNKYAAAGRED
ncbi:AAA family ATPase [Shimazuella kribbensis]|uniref:AAA family ATPase n=1 Tax=Shimazuella kribbensis TaxID=139808 RepID=UPI00041F72FF|nr:AAA family ATPase [Shimazuella kribbensis]